MWPKRKPILAAILSQSTPSDDVMTNHLQGSTHQSKATFLSSSQPIIWQHPGFNQATHTALQWTKAVSTMAGTPY